MSAQYTVASLEELAAAFEQFARDDDGFARSARYHHRFLQFFRAISCPSFLKTS